MDDLGFLAFAYLLLWLAIGGYLVRLTRRQKALEERIDELKKDDAASR